MSRRHRLAARAAAAALAAAAAAPQSAGADTVAGFDTPGTAYLLGQHANPPAAVILASGGPNGSFLRLAFDTANPPNVNGLDFERTDAGPACAVAAGFDFRITPGSGRADGLGFALLDTGVYGRHGVVAPPSPLFAPEEPGFVRSLGFGFDVYQNPESGDPDANHLSIHFDGGVPVAAIDAGAVDLASGGWIHAEIAVDAVAGTIDVALTPEGGSPVLVATDLPVPELEPYEARVHFGARSGGLAADHDVDNVVVTFTPCPPAMVGAWSEVTDWPLVAIHAHLLPTGEVMFWDRHDVLDGDPRAHAGRDSGHGGAGEETVGIIVPRLWNPATGQVTMAAEPPFDLFCSGHTFLADGRLFVAGGHVVDNVGLADAAIYDPFADAWTDLPDMGSARWYPTATTLADGDVLVVAGNISPGNPATTPEVWDVDRRAWRPLGGAVKGQPLYPMMLLLPDGRVLDAGPRPATAALDTAGEGSWAPVAVASPGVRDYGSAVMLADGRVLLAGGRQNPPAATAELLDPAAPAPAWTPTGSMSFARRQLDLTLLPDGTVLATGGTAAPGFNDPAGEVLSAEVYEPAAGEWSLLAAAAVRRIYHSTAVLLPDARVLVAGGGHPPGPGGDASHYDFEIYSPPYLFRGPRPVLAAAPERVYYGEPFTVSTPDPGAIADVTWLRPASVTHAFNMNQRINRLDFVPVAGGLEVTPPADPARCPPGHYMLFLLDGDGVPSEARFVQALPRTIFDDGFEGGGVSAWTSFQGGLFQPPSPRE